MDSADISQQAISHTYSLWSKNLENLIPVLVSDGKASPVSYPLIIGQSFDR